MTMVSILINALKNRFPAHDAVLSGRTRADTWSSWLAPFQEDSVGRDPGYEDAFFTLKDEVARLSGNDDALIVQCCERLLKEVGKDIRLASFYAFARARQSGLAGFADGLDLTAALLERFGERLLPARAEARKGAIEWFATSRMIDLLDASAPFDAAALERALAALAQMMSVMHGWPPASQAELQPLSARLTQEVPAAMPPDAGDMPVTTRTMMKDAAVMPALQPVGDPTSGRAVLEQTRAIARYLREQQGADGYLCAARLVRCIRWDTLHEVPPADTQGRTRMSAPRSELRQQLRRLMLQKQWSQLLERVEGAFMEGAGHLWFDLQYFQHSALEHAGAPWTSWRSLLRTDLALMLERLPGIERLAYQDGVPFADDETLEWLAQYAVIRDIAAGEAPLPGAVCAVLNEDVGVQQGDWPEIEAQAHDIAADEGLAAAMHWLDALPGRRAERQYFMRRLVMARVAERAGHPDAALPMLTALDSRARSLPLMRWDPVLMFEVKQQMIRSLQQLHKRKDADKTVLWHRIEKLQRELMVLDPVRACAALAG